ncbi:hypothetical protein A0O30_00350 [Pseudomonas sp. LLC-1]|nr:hypothetical protein A0O30_00350 [Pseudomonas sp. LLC-1]
MPRARVPGVLKTDLLAGRCTRCDGVVALALQSTPAIREARKQQLKSIAARVVWPMVAISLRLLKAFKVSSKKQQVREFLQGVLLVGIQL